MARSDQICGIDFGTSNSTVSILDQGLARLIPLEGQDVTLPSAVFWDSEGEPPQFGRAAIAAYATGEDGRLMRGLKSTLGSSLVHEKTKVGNRALAFTDILARFFGHMKARLEDSRPDASCAILGRPVHFVDDDAAGDRAAQDVLESIARATGFDHIGFQFEPIAAALHYEASVQAEELVLIVDIGGGTSDFSIVRVSPERAMAADRAGDILGSHGIRVGGTDFDRLLSLTEVMPALGMGSMVHGGKTAMPLHYYHDLATWHRINALYAHKVMSELKDIRHGATKPELLDRLIRVLTRRGGHAIAMAVEAAKIDLSDHDTAVIALSDILGRALPTTRAGFEQAVERPVQRIEEAIGAVLAQAGLAPRAIGTAFMTGGSSSLPIMREVVAHALPGVAIKTGDLLGSVGTGLVLDARRRFA